MEMWRAEIEEPRQRPKVLDPRIVFAVFLAHIAFFAGLWFLALVKGWLTDKPVIAATTYFLKAFPQTSNFGPHETWLNVLFCYSVLVAAHAFFLLGGILFRKYQTVATALVGSMLFLVFAHFVTHDQPYMRGIPYAWYYSCLSVFLIALTCAFTVLAYRLFCRWQIATYHFVNLP